MAVRRVFSLLVAGLFVVCVAVAAPQGMGASHGGDEVRVALPDPDATNHNHAPGVAM
jgi:hypothetical protein